jgi:hypothetical protein
MSDEQKRCLNQADRSRGSDKQPAGEEGESANSYYYDDATGYEVYQDETDDNGGEELEKEI